MMMKDNEIREVVLEMAAYVAERQAASGFQISYKDVPMTVVVLHGHWLNMLVHPDFPDTIPVGWEGSD